MCATPVASSALRVAHGDSVYETGKVRLSAARIARYLSPGYALALLAADLLPYPPTGSTIGGTNFFVSLSVIAHCAHCLQIDAGRLHACSCCCRSQGFKALPNEGGFAWQEIWIEVQPTFFLINEDFVRYIGTRLRNDGHDVQKDQAGLFFKK